jgi:hypothetical protein
LDSENTVIKNIGINNRGKWGKMGEKWGKMGKKMAFFKKIKKN